MIPRIHKKIRIHLEQLKGIKRRHYHPLVHEIHKKHNIAKRTLFYIKEYGPHSHATKTIIRESIKILLLASILSSLGGLALEQIKEIFLTITPLIILLPSLNTMIGDYGIIISSKFSTYLHEEKRAEFLKHHLRKLGIQLFVVAIITSTLTSLLALIIASFTNLSNTYLAPKIFLIALIDTLLVVSILFFISIYAGFYFWRKKEDPNNFLIPITTSIADFGNMIILSVLVILFF